MTMKVNWGRWPIAQTAAAAEPDKAESGRRPTNAAARATTASLRPIVLGETSGPPIGPLIVGCHGGAGTTTIARLLGPATDAGTTLPATVGGPLVVVSRATLDGATHAAVTVKTLRDRDLVPAVMVIIREGLLPPPRLARRRLKQLSSAVRAVVEVPYVLRWRYLDDPFSVPLPRSILRTRTKLISSFAVPNGK